MLKRWMKNIVALGMSGVLLASCDKGEYSPDEPLPETFSPSIFVNTQNDLLYSLNPRNENVNTKSISVSDLPAGTYNAVFFGKEGNAVVKFIKQ